jgi:hypothetical protein
MENHKFIGPDWRPEKDIFIMSLQKKIISKIQSLDKFLCSDDCKKLDISVRKSLDSIRLLLLECHQEFWKFESESYKHSMRSIYLEACHNRISHQEEELTRYKSAETFILSDDKENLIRDIIIKIDLLTKK